MNMMRPDPESPPAPTATIGALNERSREIFRRLVESYVETGEPVGSRTLSRLLGAQLSPATIRNVMADLEEMGFIASPHTSAGRVPTPRGYRLFVDALLTVRPVEQQQAELIRGQLQVGDPQGALQAAAQLLGSLTHFAGVVLTPRRASPRSSGVFRTGCRSPCVH